MVDEYRVEDEIHFVMTCPLYKNERAPMLNIIYEKFPNTELLTVQNMFIWLMSQEEHDTTKLLANFCKKSLDCRTKFLNYPQSMANTST